MGLKEDFEAAAEEAKTLPKASNDEMLMLYGYFKQSTVGDCNGSRPGMFDPKGRAKYDAWEKVKGMTADDAMNKYIEYVAELKAKYC